MSITLAAAQTYVARAYGGANDARTGGIMDQALDSIAAAMEFWAHKHNWHFLLQDTSQTFAVVSSSATSATLTTAVSNGFKNVLVGMTVTGTSIPTGTTVSAIASNTSLTMSAAATGAISSASITFGGTIPIIAGTDTYTLPTKFWKPYSCRLTSSIKFPLKYVQQNYVDAVTYDQTVRSRVTAYTLYNPTDFDATGTQQGKVKFFSVPNEADVALLRYYRNFDISRTTLDIPDGYIYTLLDTARIFLLRTKDSSNNKLPMMVMDMFGNRDKSGRFQAAIATDLEEGGEDQFEEMKSPREMERTGLGFDGSFWPRGDY